MCAASPLTRRTLQEKIGFRPPLKVDHHQSLKVDHHGGPCRIRSTFKDGCVGYGIPVPRGSQWSPDRATARPGSPGWQTHGAALRGDPLRSPRRALPPPCRAGTLGDSAKGHRRGVLVSPIYQFHPVAPKAPLTPWGLLRKGVLQIGPWAPNCSPHPSV